MYFEGAMDLSEMIMIVPFKPADDKQKEITTILEKANNRYFPAFEKVHGGKTTIYVMTEGGSCELRCS